MTDFELLLSKVRERSNLNEEISSILEILNTEYCPYKEGDIVAICGYSHSGKKGRITDTAMFIGSYGPDFHVSAEVLRADGSTSKFKADWKSYHDPILKEALSKLK